MTNTPFLYFDLGNVVVKFDHDVLAENLAQLAGVTAPQIRQSYFDSGVQDKYERGQISTTELHDLFRDQTGCACSQAEFELALSDIFQLNAEILPLLTSLAGSGFRLGILSNTCAAHWEFLVRRLPLLNSFFEVHALSFQLGCMKPEPSIYQHCQQLAESVGYGGGSYLFTDDRQENVAGAAAAGWRAFQFTSAKQLARDLQSAQCVFNY